MNGVVFNVQRFCLHDGPGIRTTAFLKGCPLACVWCHNPEGISREKQIMLDDAKCVRCGACARVCPRARHRLEGETHIFDREGCVACGKCVNACPAGALEIAGYDVDAQDVIDIARRDKPFYAHGGGLTLSGGEPTCQLEFACGLARSARREGIGVCVETCGFCGTAGLLELAQDVDIFLYDIKETDPERHKRYTGHDNALILENLRALDSLGKRIVLRCPVIPMFNAREEHFLAVAELANSLSHVERIELEPYHPLGIGKAAKLAKPVAAELEAHALPREAAQRFVDIMRPRARAPVIIS